MKNSVNTGFCKAVNQGIELTDTEYVLLLNNDTELDDNFLTEIVKTMEKSDEIFSVSSKMISYHDRSILDDVIREPKYDDFLKMTAVSLINEYEETRFNRELLRNKG